MPAPALAPPAESTRRKTSPPSRPCPSIAFKMLRLAMAGHSRRQIALKMRTAWPRVALVVPDRPVYASTLGILPRGRCELCGREVALPCLPCLLEDGYGLVPARRASVRYFADPRKVRVGDAICRSRDGQSYLLQFGDSLSVLERVQWIAAEFVTFDQPRQEVAP